jgi:aminopeptidase N
VSKEVDGVTINYYYYEDDKFGEHLETAINAIETFSKLFGKYPYKTFSVVKTPFIEGGMEFPTLVYISDSLEDQSFNEVIVHETAHQWWQTVVGNNEIEYGFLDEGLTEYSVVLFYENNPNYSLDRETLVKNSEQTFKTFCTVYDKLYKKVNTSMIRPLGEFTSEYEYVNIAYIKSVIMYDTLRETIGDKKFFDGLKRYYKDNAFLNAEPYSIVGAFENSGADVSGYFNSFFEGKEVL